MKKIVLLLAFIVSSVLVYSEGSVFNKEVPIDAMFPAISLDGRAAALGNSQILVSPIYYLEGNKIEVRLSQKEQMGIIPYNEYKGHLRVNNNFGIGGALITSEDFLQTNKISFGAIAKLMKIRFGASYNLLAAEIVKNEEEPTEEMQEYIEKQEITNELLEGTTAVGNSIDWVVGVDLNPELTLVYYRKNQNSLLTWSIEGEEDTEQELAEEEVIGFLYNGERVNLIGELQNYSKISLGYERNYYDKLDVRAGIARNIRAENNLTAEKAYMVGLGFNPIAKNFIIGIDVAYQMKYLGRDDIFNGKSQDDLVMTTYVKF